MNDNKKGGLNVFPITLGTMTYGNPVAFDEAVELTRYALSRGIDLIDTANMYEGYDRTPGSAGGAAERIIGRAVAGMDRSRVKIATKLGMKVGDPPPPSIPSSPAAWNGWIQNMWTYTISTALTGILHTRRCWRP